MVLNGKDTCDKVIELALSQGVDYIEARYEQYMNNQFILKNGTPELGAFDRTSGIGVRVLVEGAMGFTSFNVYTQDYVENAVKQVLKLTRASARLRKQPIIFSEEKASEGKYKVGALKSPADTSPEEKMDLLFTIDKSISNLPIPFRIVMLMDTIRAIYLITSDGSKIESEIPSLNFFGILTAVDPNRGAMEQASYSKGATGGYEWIDKWDLTNFLSTEAEILSKVAAKAQECPKGELDFVVGPNVCGLIAHENCGHPSEADRILGREAAQAGESYLNVDKLGEQIGSEYVTIIDDPTISGSYGFYKFDSEGVKARPRYLIKKGIFTEMLHNRESAGFLGTSSTGAARNSAYNREPIPRMANTYISNGDFGFDEIFEDIKLGIYMKNFSEWNIDDRRFQSRYVGREAYLIKDGELSSTLIRRPVLETTTPGLFSAIDGATKILEFDAAMCGKGDPMQGAPVWHGGPEGTRIRSIVVR
ncbi:MAG: TldD/PmbA family protein [Candidatus Heimdallarchaeota archaeon]|nr:TldD/PmbA family protein [Candidatus Heimdallarchaeota archaeon]